jgi:hypothetical protein
VTVALTGAKADERQVLLELLAVEPQLVATQPGQVLIADKHYYGREFEQRVGELGVRRLRPVRQAKPSGLARTCSSRCGSSSSRSTRPSRASWTWNATATAPASGVAFRMLQRILALTAVIWHNDKTGQPTLRSLVAYGH